MPQRDYIARLDKAISDYDEDKAREILREMRDERAAEPRPPGPLLTAVRLDLEALGEVSGGAKRSLAQLALSLAETIDTRGADAGASTTARLAQELRATLIALTTERADDRSDLAELLARLRSPVWDTEVPGPRDAGAEGGGDSAVTG